MKGVIFTIEAVYVVVAAIVLLSGLMPLLGAFDGPNFDAWEAQVVAHDIGYDTINGTNIQPPHISFYFNDSAGGNPCVNTLASAKYYDLEPNEVCMK